MSVCPCSHLEGYYWCKYNINNHHYIHLCVRKCAPNCITSCNLAYSFIAFEKWLHKNKNDNKTNPFFNGPKFKQVASILNFSW